MLRNLHHANLLVGGQAEAESYVRSLCDSLGIELKNNPDFFAFCMSTFGIDEARELRLMATRKALTQKKFFFLTPMRLTLEAQNALLKTFEDPFPNTHFFLVARDETLILPTLRSRMQIVRVSKNSISKSTDAAQFLLLPFKNRLLFAKEFVGEEKNLSSFLDDLLLLLRKRGGTSSLLENVYNFRHFSDDIAVAPRLIIEHLSLVL